MHLQFTDNATKYSLYVILVMTVYAQAAVAESTALEECWREVDTRLELAPCLQNKLGDSNRVMADTTERVHESMRELESVTGRQLYVAAFEAAQRAFMQFREANCAWRYAQASPGTGAGDFQLSCLIAMTRSRIEELSKVLANRQ